MGGGSELLVAVVELLGGGGKVGIKVLGASGLGNGLQAPIFASKI